MVVMTMTDVAEIKHMHDDLEALKQDVAVIKHILSEEGELSSATKKRLAKARKTPLSNYVEL